MQSFITINIKPEIYNIFYLFANPLFKKKKNLLQK